jgi:hypothetical protein
MFSNLLCSFTDILFIFNIPLVPCWIFTDVTVIEWIVHE